MSRKIEKGQDYSLIRLKPFPMERWNSRPPRKPLDLGIHLGEIIIRENTQWAGDDLARTGSPLLVDFLKDRGCCKGQIEIRYNDDSPSAFCECGTEIRMQFYNRWADVKRWWLQNTFWQVMWELSQQKQTKLPAELRTYVPDLGNRRVNPYCTGAVKKTYGCERLGIVYNGWNVAVAGFADPPPSAEERQTIIAFVFRLAEQELQTAIHKNAESAASVTACWHS